MAKEYPLSIVIRAVDKATSEIQRINKKVAKLGTNITSVGRDLSANLTLPILAVGAASVAALGEFQQGMSDVSTLVDTSVESLDDMSKSVLKIGRRVPVTMQDLTGSLYDVRSAGVSAADQFAVLEGAARLGVAGLGSTKESVDLVTSSVNAFALKGEKAERVYDTIFKTVKFGKTNIAQLSQGFGAVAGTVAATGTELDEYLASVSALTSVGLPASQAHSQLRAVISGLTRETAKSRKVFRALGAKDLPDLIAKSGGLVPALQRIKGELGGNTAKILDLVGSTEALNAVLGLTGEQNELYAATLESMRHGANAVDEAFKKQSRTLKATSQRTKNALISVGVSIGKIVAPALEKLAKILQRAADWFDGLDAETREWIVGIAATVAAIGPVLLITGKLITALSVLTTVVRVLGVVFLTNPIGLVATALGVLVVAGMAVVRNWDLIKAKFVAVFGWITDFFLRHSPLGPIVQNWGLISAFFVDLWDDIVDVFEWAWSKIKPIVDKVAGAASTVKDAIGLIPGMPSTGAENVVARLERESKERAASRPRLFSVDGPSARGGAPAAGSKNVIEVDFKNVLRGVAVNLVESVGDAVVDMTVGRNMEPSP